MTMLHVQNVPLTECSLFPRPQSSTRPRWWPETWQWYRKPAGGDPPQAEAESSPGTAPDLTSGEALYPRCLLPLSLPHGYLST